MEHPPPLSRRETKALNIPSMRRLLPTLLLVLLAVLSVTAAIFLAVDGNLARLTGWYHFRPGMPLFTAENTSRLQDVSWMRIQGLHDTDRIECERDADGTWWIISPFHDRMDPHAVQAILSFTANARVVGTLPLNKATRRSLREFGVETSPHTIVLKVPAGKDSYTTLARYTLGSTSPWLADAGDGRSVIPTTYLRTDYYGRDKRIHVVSGNILNLFRSGLEALRDPRPLLFQPENLRGITIRRKGEPPLRLSRASAESPWAITAPSIIAADQDKVAGLISKLATLSAAKVEEPEEVSLPDDGPETVIELEGENQQKPLKLHLYAPFQTEPDGQVLCYATAEGRPAVFTLQAEPRVSRKGSYTRIVNSVFSAPVLPARAMAQIRSHAGDVYTNELPLDKGSLRSLRFTDIDYKDIERVSLRSRFSPYPLRLLLIPGEEDSDIQDIWMYSAEGRRYAEAETEIVRRFLGSLRDIPVAGIMEDLEPGGNASALMAKYGLNSPDYVLSLSPRPCAYRATLFGLDLPLVKDRAPRVFFLSRYRNPQTGKSQWVGMEAGGHTVCQLSPKLTRLFSLDANTWKMRHLVSFPLSSLRRLTLGFLQAPLELDYDYIGESWKGRMNGEDVTPRINPHRAEYYVRQLQKTKVAQWLDADDEDALRCLATPAFYVRLELELPDYQDVEAVVMEESPSYAVLAPVDGSRLEHAAQMLEENTATDEALRQQALQEVKTIPRTITLEIAPSGEASDTPFFYGRIKETGELFMLPFPDAQGLAGSILDM